MNIFWLVVIVIIFMSVTAFLGYKGYVNTKNSLDYMVGGRKTHPYVMAMSYGATFISTSAIVGFGGAAAIFGMGILWLPVLNIFVGIFLAFVMFGKRTRRMGLNLNAHTFPELLGKRVGSKFVQSFTGIMIFLAMPLYAAAVLIGASRIIESLVGIPFTTSVAMFSIVVALYVIMGGLKGVMYTDALQGSLMFFGMILLLAIVYYKLGGIVDAHAALTSIADKVPETLRAAGHRGWTTSPETGSPLWWTLYSSIVLGVGIGVLAQPQLIIRFMTVKSNKELNRAVLIGGVFILVTVGTSLIVGALANAYYMEHEGKLAIQMAQGNADKIIPLVINDLMPNWFAYLFMLVILSAAMSTLSSQYHVIGTSIGRDFYETIVESTRSKNREIIVTKVGIVVSIILTVFLALNLEEGIIARATAIFFGLMASSLLAPYIAALYWKKLTAKGAIAGILSGVGVCVFMYLFTHQKEAAVFGLCKALTGSDTLLPGAWQVVDPLVIGLPVSLFATWLVSIFTKVESPEAVKTSFEGIN